MGEMKRRLEFSAGKTPTKRHHIINVVTGEKTMGEKYCLSAESPEWMKSPIRNGQKKPTASDFDMTDRDKVVREMKERRKSGASSGKRSRTLSAGSTRRTSTITKSSKSRSRASREIVGGATISFPPRQ